MHGQGSTSRRGIYIQNRRKYFMEFKEVSEQDICLKFVNTDNLN